MRLLTRLLSACLLLIGVGRQAPAIFAAVAGVDAIGTIDYPNGGMAIAPTFTGFKHEDIPSCGFTNSSGTRAWIGMNTTFNNISTFPGVITEVDTTSMTKLASLELAPDERGVIAAASDPTATFGYFLVDNTPARIVKVQLATMTRVASLDLTPGEKAGSMTADKTGTYAYVGLMGSPGKIVRINLSNFTRSSTLTLPAADANLVEADVDNAGEYAYFSCRIIPATPPLVFSARIVKVRLSDFTRTNSLPLGEGEPVDMAFDVANPARVYVIVRKSVSPPSFSKICRVNLDESTIDSIQTNDPNIMSINMNQDGSRALIGYLTGHLQFLNVTQFQFLPTQYPPSPVGGGVREVLTLTHSPETFLVLYSRIPGLLEKGSYANDVVTRGNRLTFDGGEDTFQSIAQDNDARYLYAGTAGSKMVKIDLARRQRVAAVQLDLIRYPQTSAATSGKYVYAGSSSNQTVRRLDGKTMQVVETRNSFADGILEELAISPYNGGLYAILNPTSSIIGSLGYADPLALAYSGLFNVPDPVKLTNFSFRLADGSFYYIDLHSALITYWQNNVFTYSNPMLGGPKAILYTGSGPLYVLAAYRLFELHPQALTFLQDRDLRSLAGSSTLTFDGGQINGLGNMALYHGSDGLGVNAQPILFKHNMNDLTQYSYLYLPSTLKKILLNRNGTQAVGLPTDGETFSRISLTSRERMEGTRLRLNETSQINTAYFYAHSSVGPRRVEVLPDYDHTNFISGFVDRVHERAWFGTNQSPGHVVSFDFNSRSIVTSVTLQADENDLQCAAGDPTGTFGYFGTFTSPARVVKIDLANGSRVGNLTLDPGENNLRAAAIDPAGSFAYFADADSPAQIIKVSLSPTFSRVGAITLEPGEGSVRDLKISPDGQFLYVCCATGPGKIVKIRLSDFTRMEVLTLESSEYSPQALAIQSDGVFMYAACATSPAAIVVKIRLSNFTREAALPLNTGEDNATGLALSDTNNYLLVACDTTPPTVARIALNNFTREAAGPLRSDTEVNLKPIFFDNEGRYAFLATNTAPGRIVTFDSAPTPLQLGLYQDVGGLLNLRWQSPSMALTQDNEWVGVPISQGTPGSLLLPHGDYLLGWQVDADESVPSYASGNEGDGIQVPLNYGNFPDTITTWTTTTSRWSMYLDYTSRNSVRDWQKLQ